MLRDWQRSDSGEETRGRVARTAYHPCGVSVHGVGVDTDAGAGGAGIGAGAGTGADGGGGAREMGGLGARIVDPMEGSCTCSMIACECGWNDTSVRGCGCGCGCGWSSWRPETCATAVVVGGGTNARSR